jgi:REP element-mobilizing transposase RayT
MRLQGYDYAQAGAYFVTMCTRHRSFFFEREVMRQIADQCWLEIPTHFSVVDLDLWVVMPNHVHGILIINENNDTNADQRRGVQLNAPTASVDDADATEAPQAHTSQNQQKPRDATNPYSVISPHHNTLAVIIRTYKAAVTTLCRRAGFDGFAWQRGYHEHVIRAEADLNRIREYIMNNPLRWDQDENNPHC